MKLNCKSNIMNYRNITLEKTMIELIKISHRAEDYSSYEEFIEKYRTTLAESYEDYIEQGHSWCLVGNIVQEHEYGEEHEIKYGTKQFSRGTKVFVGPIPFAGYGNEKSVVIGLPRYGNKYIEVITRSKYIENYRMKKVYKPAILKRMCSSQYRWWGDSEEDRGEIIEYLKCVSPEEAKRQKGLLES